MWWSLSVTCDMSVVFHGYSGFLHQWNWMPRYNWNIVESGVKHHVLFIVGISSSGTAQTMVSLKRGMTYYTTVRGITNDGSIIQVESDGVLVDRTPPTILFER
jgi:hypothetical protein